MITANQSAKLRAGIHFRTAAEEVSKAFSLICLDEEDTKRMRKVVEELHALFAKQIPNTESGD